MLSGQLIGGATGLQQKVSGRLRPPGAGLADRFPIQET
jgi:hypothetical protein